MGPSIPTLLSAIHLTLFLEVMTMIYSTIFAHVRRMFEESRDGQLTLGDDDERYECPVVWDAETAEGLARKCGTLVRHLHFLAGQYEKLKTETRHLTREQLAVWDTYLKPFPGHGLDMEALQGIWEKFESGDPVSAEERALADRWLGWFEENARMRLPDLRRDPVGLINRAKRYGKLVRLGAPAVVQEQEAKRLAEEFVLYHCGRD